MEVCVCSYLRPELLQRTLSALSRQDVRGLFEYSVIVCDNDPGESGRPIAERLAKGSVGVTYCVEPRKGIAHARNKALEKATSEFIAFIDDDEVPEKDWLYNLFIFLADEPVAGVLGPVRPLFDEEPPAWVIKGRICERPEHPTGFVMPPGKCRTGNILFRRTIIEGVEPVFSSDFVTGSDVEFFLRMDERGHKFKWCNEAVVYEVVPPSRWRRSFMLKRALLRGAHVAKLPKGRGVAVATSALAVPIYAVLLPVLTIFGHHHFMKHLVKLCDHLGRLLAFVGLRPVKEREV